jgi:hypothetical protein
MKSAITAVIITAIASPSFAAWNNNNGVSWQSTTASNLFANGCVFKDQTNGEMTYDVTNHKWVTTTAATIKVKSRGKNNIKVTSDNTLRDESGNAVAVAGVNYIGGGVMSNIQTNNSNAVKNTNTNELSLGNANRSNGATRTTFTIGGTASFSEVLSDELDNSTTYKINHTVTCIQ